MNRIGSKSLRRMKNNTINTMKKSEKFLVKILHDNKNTEYGKKYNFANIHSVEEYKKNVPLSDYSDYLPYVKRMADDGEKNLITSYPIKTFAVTSGSIGTKKMIPISKKALSKYTKYTITRAAALGFKYYKEHGKKIYVGTTLNTIELNKEPLKSGYKIENVSSAASSIMLPFMRFTHTSPMPVFFNKGNMNKQYMIARFALEDRNVANMISAFMSNLTDVMNYIKNNWQMIVNDIENGTIDDSVCDEEGKKNLARYIKKNPKRAKELREIFSQGFDTPFIPKVWKKLSWLTTIGHAGFATQTEIMKKYLGNDIPIDYSVFSPSESMIAVPYEINKPEFLLLVDCCFCEFLPVDDENADTLMLNQLEVGKEYEIILTTESGFYRYKLHDVVRVLGYNHECPIISFIYRKNMMANIAAEKTTTEHFDYHYYFSLHFHYYRYIHYFHYFHCYHYFRYFHYKLLCLC